MVEENKEKESLKFQSGNAYIAGKTDFASLLKQAGNEPKEEKKEEKKKPSKQEKNDALFRSILSQAVNRDDDEEEDAFENQFKQSEKVEDKIVETENKQVVTSKQEEQKNKKVEEKEVDKNKENQDESSKINISSNIENVEKQTTPVKNDTITTDTKINQEKEKSKESDIVLNVKKEDPKTTIDKKSIEENEEVSTKTKNESPKVGIGMGFKKNTSKSSNEEKNDNSNLLTLEELLAGGTEDTVETQGVVLSAEDIFATSEMDANGKIKKTFNPNPDKKLIEGHDFNDPYLDDIYNYTYSEEISVLRKRKEEQRQQKLAERIAEEKKQEQMKSAKQKKKEEKEKKKQEKWEAKHGPIEQIEYKPKKELKVPDKYPKTYVDPTDEEIDEKTGKPYHYFNFTKTLENSSLRFLGKIIPTAAIDDVLYDKGFLDGVADRQHDKFIKLNNMSPEEQYSRDLRNIAIKIGTAAVFAFAVFFKITFGIIPDNKYDAAVTAMESKDYENSYYMFTELGNKELSVYYAKYSEAKMLYKNDKFQEAKEAFTMLLPFEEEIFKPDGMNITDEVAECSYQIALNYYYDGDFETAKDIFKEIYTYSDSTERYYECGYKIAKEAYEDYQDDADLKKALKYFYRVRKYSSDDTLFYIQTIQDLLYEQADGYYKNQEYEKALDLFEYLSLFKYVNEDDNVNSSDMVYQCQYRHGLDLYKNRQFESARKTLSEIPEYKDSYVLSKECIYNIAQILYENNPVGSIAEYRKINGYRDASNTLYSPRLLIYGEWSIVEMNGSAITPVTFDFFDDGQFKTNKQILGVAISTDATPYYYEWDGEKFTAHDGEYTITTAYDEELNRMIMTCSGPNQSIQYACKRALTYEDLILKQEGGANTETAEETMNQKYRNLIQDYVDKKLDHIVYKNGEDVDMFTNLE